MSTIILTGGGTAGHVTPNLALVEELQKRGHTLHYIGTANGMEKDLVAAVPGIEYHHVRAGKLRRYFSLKTIPDVFRVLGGYFDAKKVIRQINPQVIFSKGGFVTVPVVYAGKKLRVPVVIHESDYTPGLANRLNARKADKVLVTFEDTLPYTKGKGVVTGTPIRRELLTGDGQKGLEICGFDGQKPLLLCMGGSQGAEAVNKALRSRLSQLLEVFDVVNLCGKGKTDPSLEGVGGYRQFEYVTDQLPHLFAAASVALSRAGANSVFEFLALSLPALLIPLPSQSSRGDQIQNARYFEKRGYAMVLMQQDITEEKLFSSIMELYNGRDKYISAMKSAPVTDGTALVVEEICKMLTE